MGKEISVLDNLGVYDLINNKASIKLWLHNMIEGAAVPAIVSMESLSIALHDMLSQGFDETYAALSHNHDDAYAALSHNHDDAYAALSHNHDDAYAALSHNHEALQIGTMIWTGDHTLTREISFGCAVPINPKLCVVISVDTSNICQLFYWIPGLSSNNRTFHRLSVSSNWSWSSNEPVNVSVLTYPDKMIVLRNGFNLNSYTYHGVIWGDAII